MVWRLDRDEIFSAKGVYHLLTEDMVEDPLTIQDLIWNKLIPLKASLKTIYPFNITMQHLLIFFIIKPLFIVFQPT